MPTLSPTRPTAARSHPLGSRAAEPLHVLWVADSLEAASEAAQIDTFAGAVDPSRIRIDLCPLGGRNEGEVASGLRRRSVALHPVEARGGRDPAAFFRLYRLIRRGGYDLVHTHLPWASQWGGTAGRLLGVPVVATLYGRPPEEKSPHPGSEREAWVLGRWARRIMAQSGAQWDQYVREGVFSRAVLEVVHPGVHVLNVPAGAREALWLRRECDFPAGAQVAVTVASLDEWDSGVDTLLWAVPSIVRSSPQARFVIVGEGTTKSELERRTRARGLNRFVHWAPAGAEAAQILGGADLFIQPSLRNAFPVEALNAMAAGLPVVGTRVGGVPEIIGTPDVGRLVARSDPEALARAVVALFSDPEGLRSMGAAARRRVLEAFSAPGWVERTEEVYRDVVEEVRAGKPRRKWSHARFSVELLRPAVEARPR